MTFNRIHYLRWESDEVVARSDTPLPDLKDDQRAELDVERKGELLTVMVSDRWETHRIDLNREEALALAAYIWGSYSE